MYFPSEHNTSQCYTQRYILFSFPTLQSIICTLNSFPVSTDSAKILAQNYKWYIYSLIVRLLSSHVCSKDFSLRHWYTTLKIVTYQIIFKLIKCTTVTFRSFQICWIWFFRTSIATDVRSESIRCRVFKCWSNREICHVNHSNSFRYTRVMILYIFTWLSWVSLG